MRLQVQIWLKGTLKKDCERSCKITAVIWYSNMLFGSQSAKFSMTKTETLLEKAIWSNAPSKRICPLHGWIESYMINPAIQDFGFFCTWHGMLNATCPLTISLTKAFAHVMWADWRVFFPGYIKLFVHSESQ